MTERELELLKEARREYKKKWRQQNPDKVKAAHDRYWLKKAAEMQNKEVTSIEQN